MCTRQDSQWPLIKQSHRTTQPNDSCTPGCLAHGYLFFKNGRVIYSNRAQAASKPCPPTITTQCQHGSHGHSRGDKKNQEEHINPATGKKPPATLCSDHQQKSMTKAAGWFLGAHTAWLCDPTIQVLRTCRRQSTQAICACRFTAAQGRRPEARHGHTPSNPGPGR